MSIDGISDHVYVNTPAQPEPRITTRSRSPLLASRSVTSAVANLRICWNGNVRNGCKFRPSFSRKDLGSFRTRKINVIVSKTSTSCYVYRNKKNLPGRNLMIRGEEDPTQSKVIFTSFIGDGNYTRMMKVGDIEITTPADRGGDRLVPRVPLRALSFHGDRIELCNSTYCL